MTKFYEEMQGIASGLLQEFDQSRGTGQQNDGLWYVRLTPGSGPAHNPGEPQQTPYKMNGAGKSVAFKYVDDTNIFRSDRQATFAVRSDGIKPELTGYILADGVKHKIIDIKQIPPTGVPVAHVVIFRKG